MSRSTPGQGWTIHRYIQETAGMVGCKLAVAAIALLASTAASGCIGAPSISPTVFSITLTSTAATLPQNGTGTIVAQMLTTARTPPPDGTIVQFTTTLGTIDPASAPTVGGRATATFRAGAQSGVATITATSAGVNADKPVSVSVGAAAFGTILVGTTPGTLSANGGFAVVSATVLDVSGNPLAGVAVTFTTDAGSVSPTTVSTDASGKAQSTLTTNRTAKVTATAGAIAANGASTSSSVTVSVNATAAITAGSVSPSAPTAGQTVTIPLTYGGGGTASAVTSVSVAWGDGAVDTVTGQPGALSHTFSSPGSYLVRITGVDALGDRTSTSVSVNVETAPQVTVAFSATTVGAAATATSFSLTITPPTGHIVSAVSIAWGDGTTSALVGNTTGLQHVYQTAGTYTATAVAVDNAGARGSASTTFVVSAAAPAAGLQVGITADASPTVGTATSFTVTLPSSGNAIVQVVFNWGDGTSTTANGRATNAQHVYTTVGTYVVTATATDTSGATGVASVVIRVNP